MRIVLSPSGSVSSGSIAHPLGANYGFRSAIPPSLAIAPLPVTIQVASLAIHAVNESGTIYKCGVVVVERPLGNETLNGAGGDGVVTLTLTQSSTTNPGITLQRGYRICLRGAPRLLSAAYTLTYRICRNGHRPRNAFSARRSR